jgi:hypothetical protein
VNMVTIDIIQRLANLLRSFAQGHHVPWVSLLSLHTQIMGSSRRFSTGKNPGEVKAPIAGEMRLQSDFRISQGSFLTPQFLDGETH